MSNCIFCKIANGEMPAKILFEDEEIIAFHDIDPKAPVHLLVVPKKHISTISDLSIEDAALTGKIIIRAREIAKELGISGSGYRLVFNCGREGGQAVYHIHLHLLGGRPMKWPPG